MPPMTTRTPSPRCTTSRATGRTRCKTEEPLVDSEIKAGQTPKEDQLKILLNTCIKLEDAACQQHALERMVTYYPKPDYLEAAAVHGAQGRLG